MASENISTIQRRREKLEKLDERQEVLETRIIYLTGLIIDEEEHVSSVRKGYTLAEAGILTLQDQLNSLTAEQKKLQNAKHGVKKKIKAETVNSRVRLSSEPSDAETPDEAGGIRTRSQSAPPNLWKAMRYGRELRRMSDEFDMTIKGFPRPKSAGDADEMKKGGGWTAFFREMFGPNRRKEEPEKPKKF